MTDQPNDTSLAGKLKHCQSVVINGTTGCPYLLKGGVCGFQKLREGPRKGQFPTLAEVQTCPARWAEKAGKG